MVSPNEYLQRIGQIVGDDVSDGTIDLKISWEDRSEGKATIQNIRKMVGELRLLTKEVNWAISSIKSHYISERSAVGKGLGV